MSSTPTQRLRLAKQAPGDNLNAWGIVFNTAVIDMLDDAFGVVEIQVNGPVTLTSNNYVSDQSRAMVLRFTGAGGFPVTVPGSQKAWMIDNRCAADVTLKTASDPGTTIFKQSIRWAYCDGTTCTTDNTKQLAEAVAQAIAAAAAAQAAAAAAATYDPTQFYTKAQADTATNAAIALQGVAQADFRTALIEIAKLKGATVGMLAGVADSFADQTGVDTVNSTGFVYDATLKAFTNQAVTVAPDLTSDTAPAGYSATASSTGTGAGPSVFNAFNANDGNADFQFSNTTLPQSLTLQHPSSAVTSYAFTFQTAAQSPTAWTLQGSNDNATWVNLDSRTGQTAGVSVTLTYAVPEANWVPYTYHRFLITAVGTAGSNATVRAIKYTFAAAITALDLRSVAFTASAAPTKASLFVIARRLTGLSVITPNTNLTASASRDNGTTNTNFMLAQRGTLSTGEVIFEANNLDISSQPSGTNLKWKILVPNTIGVRVSDVVFQWG